MASITAGDSLQSPEAVSYASTQAASSWPRMPYATGKYLRETAVLLLNMFKHFSTVQAWSSERRDFIRDGFFLFFPEFLFFDEFFHLVLSVTTVVFVC